MPFDNDITITDERLLSCGIVDLPQARKNLELLRKTLGAEQFSTLVSPLAACLSTAADPDLALNNFERFVSALTEAASFPPLCGKEPGLLTSLITVFGASRFLATFLLSDTDRSLSLLADRGFLAPSPGKPLLAKQLADLVGGDDEKDFFRSLRLFRKREMLRIGLRDLLNRADLRETVEDLSDLAEVVLQAAYAWADAALRDRHGSPMLELPDGTAAPARFAVIAMGKLGGRELNFSSDVDLMYVYTGDGETEGASRADGTAPGRITNHQYFIRLAEKLSAAIGQKTEDGFVFRVDLRLRPEGQRGPLAQSLGGYEIYYESWGQTWERAALIKARPVAGDEALGREFLERITPFVFRKYLDFSAIAEIRDMKQKINKDVEQKGRSHRDVKLGYGGIREIEFVVQALQLIYAGRDRSLREKNALRALHALSQKGLVTYREQDALARAYVFLRTVEHRIQILDDLQTQTMPSDEREVRALARRAGYFEHGREADLLLRDYAEHTRKVRAIYDDLFAFTGEERVQDGLPREYALLLDRETPEQDALDLFERYGFRDPAKAHRDLILLREGEAFVHQTPRSRRLFNEIFPALFQEMVTSPDPDMALNHLESFLAAQGSWESFQALLRLDAAAGRLLISIFANSEYFSRMLINRPALLQNLLESRRSYGTGTCAVFARGLAEALERAPDLSEKLDALRRFKHQEEIRLGLADLLSGMGLRAVSRDLSKLAEVCLDAALKLAAAEVGRRFHASVSVAGLAIIGVGKLGGRELTYGSDLDILFVYSEQRARSLPDGVSAFELFSKVAEKTISYLSTLTREGFAFRIDTRLRPTGSKGPLVQSIEAFRSYYAGEAETWERQALLRARPVAGDSTVGGEFRSGIRSLIYRDPDREALAQDVRAMRRRMEEEIGREDRTSYNIKQGSGGLVDIEFIVQYLQLLHGKRHLRLQVPGTENALHVLGREGLLTREQHDRLQTSYRFLRRLESRMRIVSNQASSDLSKDALTLHALALRMGYEDGDSPAGRKMLDEYLAVSRQVRELFGAVLGARGTPGSG
ncbi:MAG TPA: bifunctional [glutamate--ammonia ligase]-adenylyl-L-tyrosine phosphorylase/[glutamate--ammonia-ligase] adenylyltransferase [Nitrospirota bacterium]|nr:bifunctional [glutamate--ammonia ligase]-adenylyl-L-tyrosine phosphorylase/[glutamate--ammonia-ligase] adenylyltransferase [Nitrospirota bacterium]